MSRLVESEPGPELPVLPRTPHPTGPARAPSRDALLFLLSALAYLLLLGAFVIVSNGIELLRLPVTIPSSLFDARDLMALFGWVGLTISGVSTIVVPGHFGVPIRPQVLVRFHLVVANTGVAGFFLSSLLGPTSLLPSTFLLVVGASYLVFALGVIRTLKPFASGPTAGPRSDLAPVLPAPPRG